jgi:hypothetical protein
VSINKILIVFILFIMTSCQKDDLMSIDNRPNVETDSIKSIKLSHLVNKLPNSKIKKKKRLKKSRKLKFKKSK